MARRRYDRRRSKDALGTVGVMPAPMQVQEFLTTIGNVLLGFAATQICQAIEEATAPHRARHRARHDREGSRQQGRSEVIREIARGKSN